MDFRYAVRTLLKNPLFTLIAIVTLGLGIGVNTVIYSCMNAVILRPFPYRDPDQLVGVRERYKMGSDWSNVSYPNFHDWRESSRAFTGLVALSTQSFNLAARDGEPERLIGTAMTFEGLRVLGIQPLLGRSFLKEEDQVGGPKVVLIGEQLWMNRYDGDRAAVGKQIELNGDSYTIIGVMPSTFAFPDVSTLWVPLQLSPTENRGNHFLEVIGRLAPGVSVSQAGVELAGIAKRLEQQYPASNTGWSTTVRDLHELEVGSETRTVLLIMMGAVAFVLLIACANVANLLIAKATVRYKEIAIRTALGASRGRIVRQLLTESLIIALLGGMLGVAFAYVGLKLVVAGIPIDLPFWMRFTIDGPVLLFTLGLAIATGLLFGLAPALQLSSPDMHEALKEGGRNAGAGQKRQRLRSVLVVGEIALSLVLLIGATLMIRSFVKLQTLDPGFERDHLLTLRTAMAGSPYDSSFQRKGFVVQTLERLRAVPGVTEVAGANIVPFSGSNNSSSFTVEGQDVRVGDEPTASWRSVTPGYFPVLGISLVKGRVFTEQELRDSVQLVVINEAMAKRFWEKTDPLGKRIRFGRDTSSAWMTVIGVVKDVRIRPLDESRPNQFYVSFSRSPQRNITFMVKTSGNPAQATNAVRAVIRNIDPKMPVFSIFTMEQLFERSMWQQRLYGWMFGVFAAIAVLLAATGVYGVMAYMVVQRTQEIGVRMALGARAADVTRLMVGRGLWLAGIGLIIGLVAAFGVTRVLASLLFGISPNDPLTFVGISALLTGVALIASYVPARRAAQIDPLIALRSE